MKVWDLHCDTLSVLRHAENEGQPLSFAKNSLHVDLERMKQGDYLLQCFACYVNLGEKDDSPLHACLEMTDLFWRLAARYPDELMPVLGPEDIEKLPASGKIGAMLTIEEGAVCLDDVRVLRLLYRLGARMMTLTWNYENGLASPNIALTAGWAVPDTAHGLKEKGFAFLEEMERLRMIVDVSHLSDAGIRDVIRAGTRPFAASHSNARALCGHARNLPDDMIRAMGERGCLIGLNFCPSFLDASAEGHRERAKSRVSDLAAHARHIMQVGGEDILGLGSDFDGIEGDLEISGAQDMPALAEGLRREGFTSRQIEKIFCGNAMRFFRENL